MLIKSILFIFICNFVNWVCTMHTFTYRPSPLSFVYFHFSQTILGPFEKCMTPGLETWLDKVWVSFFHLKYPNLFTHFLLFSIMHFFFFITPQTRKIMRFDMCPHLKLMRCVYCPWSQAKSQGNGGLKLIAPCLLSFNKYALPLVCLLLFTLPHLYEAAFVLCPGITVVSCSRGVFQQSLNLSNQEIKPVTCISFCISASILQYISQP